MKEILKYLVGFVLGLLFLPMFCKKTETATTPVKKGKFTSTEIKHEKIERANKGLIKMLNSVKKPNNINYKNLKINKLYKSERANKGPRNEGFFINLLSQRDSLLIVYAKMNDSLKLAMFEKATEIKAFSKEFDDNDINASIKGFVAGEVKEISLDYTIKPISIPEVKYRILFGGGISNNRNFDKPLFEANAGFQNKKGNIFLFSYDNENRIGMKYILPIYTNKK